MATNTLISIRQRVLFCYEKNDIVYIIIQRGARKNES